MNKLFSAIVLLATTFTFAAISPANYVGTWALDTGQRKDLPKHLQNVNFMKLHVTQDNKVLKVVDETKWNGEEASKLN